MVSDSMGYTLERLTNSSTWLLVLRGTIDPDAIYNSFYAASLQMQRAGTAGRLIVDLNPAIFATDNDVKIMLNTIWGALLNTDFDSQAQYALLSNHSAVMRAARELEARGLQMPVFRKLAEVLSSFNLKESSERLKQSMEHTKTQDVRHVQELSIDLPREINLTSEQGNSRFPAKGLLKLTAVKSDDTMLLSPQSELVLGRRSLNGLQPHVDLTLWGAYEQGISRRHAKLLLNSEGQLCITELGSANGTFVNDKQLEPFQQYVLHEFDTIRLGQMSIRISYENVPNA